LVPLVGSENDRLSLDVSFGLAGDLSAHADALFVRPDPENAAPYLGFGDVRLEDMREDFRRHAEQTGKKAAAKARRQYNAGCKKYEIGKVRRPGIPGGLGARWVSDVSAFGTN
jgi:hypothetical protein